MKALTHFLQNARILIVDDEPANVRLLEYQLEDSKRFNFRSTTDAREALPLFEQFKPDLILLDLMMPYIDGFQVMEKIIDSLPTGAFLPIVVLTADMTSQTRRKALQMGAKDFLLKPFDADELELRVRNLLEARFFHLGLREQNQQLEDRVQERTRDLEKTVLELKAAQQQLIHQERLHAFATMAGGVAHDFNNSLTIMMGYCDVLLDEGGFDSISEARQNVEVIFQATKDAAKMVDRLRNFYRPKAEHEVYTPLQLAELVRSAVELAQPKWKNLARGNGSYIVVTTDVPEDLGIRGDASELREMLLNLIFNAVDAMPKGGHLSVRARATARDVILEVSDTGTGMSEEIKRRCLEPFFTTKGESGTGLGLAMVLGIVRRHEGTLDIHTENGRGTMFAIRLPREIAQVARARGPEEGKLPPLRILFADDDAAIRRVVPMSLGRSGHQVTVACDGSEALELYEPGKYDLVLTDLSMPRMSGEKLARAIKELSADQPIIILTGYADMLLKNGPKPAFVDLLLNKPVTSDQLSSAIAKVLPAVSSSRQLQAAEPTNPVP